MSWFSALVATACLVAGLVHLLRLAVERDGAAAGTAHAVMALGMAAMFVPAADPVPPPAWAVLFGASGAWAAVATARAGTGEAGHHVVGAVAMLLMLLPGHSHAPGSGGSEHAGHLGQDAGLLSPAAIVLAGWSAWHVLRCADRLAAARASVSAAPASPAGVSRRPVDGAVRSAGTAVAVRPLLAPVVEAAHVAVAAAMTVMLLAVV